MAFRGREMMKNIVKRVGQKNMRPPLMESLKKHVPDSKIVMNRAKRGLFAGKHIRFGNRVSEDGGNKSRRSWKPNIQDKRLFSYILDRHIKVKVTVHALRCIDKAGGIDEYLLKTPYQKMDTEAGLFWKAKIEKLYEELGSSEVLFFQPQDEANFEEEFEEMRLVERKSRAEEAQKLSLSDKTKRVGEEEDEAVVAEDSSTATAAEDSSTATAAGRDKDHPYPGKGAVIFNF